MMMQETFDGEPGPEDWRQFVRDFIDYLIRAAEGLLTLRAPDVAHLAIRRMPFGLIGDAAYHGVEPFVRRELKSRGMIGVPDDEQGGVAFKFYRQLELPEAIAWAQSNYQQRQDDEAAAYAEMGRMIADHPEWELTVEKFCELAGVPVPRV